MLVVGDIGGTKTLLACFGPASDPRRPLAMKEYQSASYSGLDVIVRSFLQETGHAATVGCFDVAGPVVRGEAKITNLPWVMSEAGLAQAIGLSRVVLLNDLKAIASAVPHLLESERHTINPGQPEERGPIAVVAPGTGLGEAFLVWGGSAYIACASEGGHASFAPADDQQAGLWRYLRQRFGEVSFERVCSGIGIPNIYDYLRDSGAYPETPAFAARLARAADRTPLISQAGLQDAAANPLAAATMAMFVSVLAGEAGNLALKVMATGGVFLAGGIPAHVLPLLTDGRFFEAFAAKGRLGAVLRRMPVHVVTARAALLGAALCGLEQIGAA